jgi:hypothetical protein
MAEGTVAFVDRIGASQLGLLASLEQRGILGVARSHEDICTWLSSRHQEVGAAVVSCERTRPERWRRGPGPAATG